MVSARALRTASARLHAGRRSTATRCARQMAGAREQLRADRRVHDGEIGIHCTMDDGNDEVSKVMTVAGGARRGLVSSALNVDNAPCRDNCFVKPDGYVIPPTGGPECTRNLRDVGVK